MHESGFGPEADIDGLGMRRSTLLELSSMELHEIAHVHRYFVGKLAHSIRHAVITPLPGQLGHGREMLDEVFRKLRLPKAFAPRREWDVAISDGPAERLREDVEIGEVLLPPIGSANSSEVRTPGLAS